MPETVNILVHFLVTLKYHTKIKLHVYLFSVVTSSHSFSQSHTREPKLILLVEAKFTCFASYLEHRT